MSRFKLICLLLMFFIAVTPVPVQAYEAFQGPSEVIQYDPDKAFNGYTLFSPFRGKNTYLIDMEGNVVHMWPYPEWAITGAEAVEKHARLLEDGTLVRGHKQPGATGTKYQMFDWNGNVLWEYEEKREGYNPHHDFKVIWNPELKQKTFMYLCQKPLSHEEAIALGCNPELRNNYRSRPDGIVEVDMYGNVIWEWFITDHLVQDINPDLPNYGIIKDHPEKFDPNFAGGRRGDWIHINSFDHNEVLDQVVINNSTDSEFFVVDHGATFAPGDSKKSIELAASDAGDFIYRWGNPCISDAGDCPSSLEEGQSSTNGHQQTFFTHDIQWIREKEVTPMKWELPGAGNFLIFDNGRRRLGPTYSSVLEINPYKGDWRKGVYVSQMDAGYSRSGGRSPNMVSKQVVWSFKSSMPNAFYGDYISGCQRLPNGNTLICSGPHGHFFEVTKKGEVVWEYISPVGDNSKSSKPGIFKIMIDEPGGHYNAVFRAHRYAPDYPGLKGKELKPMGLITELFKESVAEKPVGPFETGRGPGRGAGGSPGGTSPGGRKGGAPESR